MTKKGSKSSGGKSHRSAISGRYVTARTAARNPRTTVSEARGKGKGGGKKRK
jgi:hypothetical protein